MKSLVDNESFEFSEGVTPEGLEDHESTRCGEYTGDGNSSQHINLGKKPKSVIIAREGVAFGLYDSNTWTVNGGIVIDGNPLTGAGYTLAEIDSTGFTVSYIANAYSLNTNTYKYRYIAFFN